MTKGLGMDSQSQVASFQLFWKLAVTQATEVGREVEIIQAQLPCDDLGNPCITFLSSEFSVTSAIKPTTITAESIP